MIGNGPIRFGRRPCGKDQLSSYLDAWPTPPRPPKQVGLDQHQVHTWKSWHRYTALVLVAFAFLAILATGQPRPTPTINPGSGRVHAFSIAEIRRLLPHIFTPPNVGLQQVLS